MSEISFLRRTFHISTSNLFTFQQIEALILSHLPRKTTLLWSLCEKLSPIGTKEKTLWEISWTTKPVFKRQNSPQFELKSSDVTSKIQRERAYNNFQSGRKIQINLLLIIKDKLNDLFAEPISSNYDFFCDLICQYFWYKSTWSTSPNIPSLRGIFHIVKVFISLITRIRGINVQKNCKLKEEIISTN